MWNPKPEPMGSLHKTLLQLFLVQPAEHPGEGILAGNSITLHQEGFQELPPCVAEEGRVMHVSPPLNMVLRAKGEEQDVVQSPACIFQWM